MSTKYLKDQRGLAFVFEIILIAAVLAAVSYAGVRYYQHTQARTGDNAGLQPGGIQAVPAAHNDFGFDLVKKLYAAQPNDNIFISPTSVAMALSMAYNGAGGETQAAFAKTLHLQGIDIATVNQSSRQLIDGLAKADPQVEISIANSLWADRTFKIKPEFIQAVEQYYGAKASTLNFKSSTAKNTINKWANDQTHGKIPKIVDSTADEKMFLINATYFKGSWTTEFDKALTANRKFTPATGAALDKPFMRRGGEMSYAETDNYQSVSLPYGKSGRLAMQVVLPKNLGTFIKSLSASEWDKLLSRSGKQEGTLYLPKFTLTYEQSLNKALQELGLGVAFTDQANFSGIAPSLAVTKVQHKTFVDVNESGTEAAAVTSIGATTTSVGGPKVKFFTMDVNRPFFVAIRDTSTGEILFTGLIQKP